MKSMMLAALLLAATAHAAPVLTHASVNPTAGANTHHATLTLTESWNIGLRLHAISALSNDLTFDNVVVSQGATSFAYSISESWAGGGNNWAMNYNLPTLLLGSGTWDIALKYNDTEGGGAEKKRSAFDWSLATATVVQTAPAAAVPEPASLALMAAGLLALAWTTRRKGVPVQV